MKSSLRLASVLPLAAFVMSCSDGAEPPGPPAQLGVATAPSGAVSGVAFTGQPTVEIRDARGTVVTAGAVAVTASISSLTGTLKGTTTVTSANGVATFTNLSIAGSGSYAISFAATGLTGTTTTELTVAPPEVRAISLSTGDKQSAFAGTAVEIRPSVRVTGVGGGALAGARVTFVAGSGGGTVTGGTVITDANGVATVGGWMLGATPNFNTLVATVEGSAVVGNPATISASGCSPGGPGYKLTLCFTSDMAVSQRTAFTAAAARWESIITNDPEDGFSETAINAGSCGLSSYRIPANLVIDDLLIFAAVVPIDGPGSVLGSAGPCFFRLADATGQTFALGDSPVIGQMRFDAADMAGLEANNQLNSVILHEMGHVIGIGVIWDFLGLLNNKSDVGVPRETYFSGANAITGFNEIGFSAYAGDKVPVENTGGAGTINSHWRETTLTNELMTGFLNAGNNPLTALTVRSLADIGYTVNVAAADPFTTPPSLSSAAPGRLIAPVRLGNDLYAGPMYGIARRGRVIRIR